MPGPSSPSASGSVPRGRAGRSHSRCATSGAATLIGPIAQIDGTNTTQHGATGLPGAAGNTFSVGAILGVRSTVTGATFAPITADVTIFVLVAFTGP